MSICGIAPNMHNIKERLGHIINVRANEVFDKFMSIIGNTKIISEIVEVAVTEDTNVLLKAFSNKLESNFSIQ